MNKLTDAFPKIEKNQVVLVRAEYSTGIVLNDKFEYCKNGVGRSSIFENIELAKKYIEQCQSNRNDTEYIVYGKSQNVLLYITPNGQFDRNLENI